VYRKSNQLADWLANVAKELTMSQNLTNHLNHHHNDLSPFSEPPFSPKAVSQQLQQSPEPMNLVGFVGDFQAGQMGKKEDCSICKGETKWVVDR
jgi:hypothetical protein